MNLNSIGHENMETRLWIFPSEKKFLKGAGLVLSDLTGSVLRMERKEPALVPEWLKGGASGGAGGTLPFSHPSFHQDGGRLNSPSHKNSKSQNSEYSRVWDYDSLPYATSESEFYTSLRRPASSRGGFSDKSNPDADTFSRSKLSLSGQTNLHHSNESLDRDLRSRVPEYDWSYDKDHVFREWGKDRTSAFTAFTRKEKDQEASEFSGLRGLNSVTMTRQTLPLRRVQSMVASHGINGGDEEIALTSPGAHIDGMRVGSTRASTPPALMSASSESIVGVREAEERYTSSGLAARSHLIGSNSTSIRETTTKPAEEPSTASGVTNLRPTLQTLRLEEFEVRQSRQLVPMKPSFPKTMAGSPREKLKPKVTRSVEMGSSILPKGTQALSQAVGVAHRPIMSNKLTVWKSNKEVITPSPLSNAVTEKLDGNSVLSPSSSSGRLLVDPVGTPQLSGSNAASTSQRKLKELLDKRSMPSPSRNYRAENGPAERTKEQSAGAEEKRFSSQAKKRTDFFNTLRRKAAESGHSQSSFGRSDSELDDKTEETLKKSELDVSPSKPESDAGVEAAKLHESRIIDSKAGDGDDNTIFPDTARNPIIVAHSDNQDNSVVVASNGLMVDDVDFVIAKSPLETSDKASDAATNSEEEEEAFMRSLGWEDNVEEEEALTEQEIRDFYEQYGEALANKSRTFQRKQNFEDFVMPSFAESPGGSISSDLSSSEAD